MVETMISIILVLLAVMIAAKTASKVWGLVYLFLLTRKLSKLISLMTDDENKELLQCISKECR